VAVSDWLLSKGLAKWKLPEQVIVWDEPFPYTASGKIIRRELAAAGSERPTYNAKRLQVDT
jgi:non-ribosomal peptide synthetase component E (peptide arylation enzyme)